MFFRFLSFFQTTQDVTHTVLDSDSSQRSSELLEVLSPPDSLNPFMFLLHIQILGDRIFNFDRMISGIIDRVPVEAFLRLGSVMARIGMFANHESNVEMLEAVDVSPISRQAQPLPEQSDNAKKLSDAGVDMHDIPEEFCCALSSEIMDDPVIDPTTLNPVAVAWLAIPEAERETCDSGNYYNVPRYEQRWIEQVMQRNNNLSPNTRQPIARLISDSDMKSRIDDFVRLQVSVTSALSF